MGRDLSTGLTRRGLLAGAAMTAAAITAAARVAASELIPFGSAVMISEFRSDPRMREALSRHCQVITPMNELKWEALRHSRAGFDFKAADEIIDFAKAGRKKIHGHGLLWHAALPPWAQGIRDAREAERELVSHIETVVTRYKGVIGSWDVTNEIIASELPGPQAFRDSLWFRTLGPRLVDLAFQAAARADPAARLVMNDYDFENPDERTAERRRQALRLVRHLQDRKIPVHEVGLQAHLYGERQLDTRGITAFCRELGRLGVGVRITELDVIDWRLPGPAAERDRLVADLTTRFLGAVIEGQRPQAIITWGLTDRSTWISDTFPRRDGFTARPLPFDRDWRPKPMLAAIEAARRLPTPRA
jgi:endo-1,4-beta-xylanase